MGQLVKYMGSADVRIIEKGDTFDGQLPDGLSATLQFDKSNHWVVDTEELSADEVEVLLGHEGFKDVTSLKRVPDNLHQRTFTPRSGKAPSAADLAGVQEEDEDEDTESAKRKAPGGSLESTAPGANPAPPVGGSTASATSGGKGGKPGGST